MSASATPHGLLLLPHAPHDQRARRRDRRRFIAHLRAVGRRAACPASSATDAGDRRRARCSRRASCRPARSSPRERDTASPVVVTPCASPPAGSSVTTSPGAPSIAVGARAAAHDGDARVAEQRLDAQRRRTAACASSATFARKWSSRPPAPPTTTICSAPARLGRDERELEVGRVLVGGMALDDARRARPRASTAAGSAESKSPTTQSTCSPSASAWCTPESAATTYVVVGQRARGCRARPDRRPRARSPRVSRAPSLRRHYPEQVRGVGGRSPQRRMPPSQPGSPELPVGCLRVTLRSLHAQERDGSGRRSPRGKPSVLASPNAITAPDAGRDPVAAARWLTTRRAAPPRFLQPRDVAVRRRRRRTRTPARPSSSSSSRCPSPCAASRRPATRGARHRASRRTRRRRSVKMPPSLANSQ